MTNLKEIDFNSLVVVGDPSEAGTKRVYFEDKNGNEVFKYGSWQQGRFVSYGNYFVSLDQKECSECHLHRENRIDCRCNGFGVEVTKDLGRD